MRDNGTEMIIRISTANNFRNLNALELEVVHTFVWSAENYLYNKMTDLSPEEVAKAKETTNAFEQLFREVLVKYKKVDESWERCRKMLSEDTFSETIWQEAVDNTDKFLDFSSEVIMKCEVVRQEMLKNIRDSGVKP